MLYIHPLSSDTNITISSQKTTDRIVVKSAAKITLNGVNIDRSNEGHGYGTTSPILIDNTSNFDVTVLLADGSENFLIGCGSNTGLNKRATNTGALTIGVPKGANPNA